MEPLFKYMEPRWAGAMLAGSLRIGTFNGFRQMETVDAERGDAGEGTKVLHSDNRPRIYDSTAELPPVMRSESIECGPGGIATNGPNAIVIETRVADLYVYCVTEHFDAGLMNEFGGACVRIDDPRMFFGALDRCFRARLAELGRPLYEGWTVDRCFYGARRQNYHAELPVSAYLLKPERYARQREVRALWQPIALPIEPVSITCAAAAQFCSRHA